MITESTIYWITRLDGIKDGIIGIGVVLAILFIIGTIISFYQRWPEDWARSSPNKKSH